jgi:hypothetical protein
MAQIRGLLINLDSEHGTGETIQSVLRRQRKAHMDKHKSTAMRFKYFLLLLISLAMLAALFLGGVNRMTLDAASDPRLSCRFVLSKTLLRGGYLRWSFTLKNTAGSNICVLEPSEGQNLGMFYRRVEEQEFRLWRFAGSFLDPKTVELAPGQQLKAFFTAQVQPGEYDVCGWYAPDSSIKKSEWRRGVVAGPERLRISRLYDPLNISRSRSTAN